MKREIKIRRTKAELNFQKEFGLRKCCDCEMLKPVDQFNTANKERTQHKGYCKDCEPERKRIYKERVKARKMLAVEPKEGMRSFVSKIFDWLKNGKR